MPKLHTELERLYFLPGQALPPAPLRLVGADGESRCLVLGLSRGEDWEALAKLCAAVQDELALPAPALSVSPTAGYQAWFSLAEPVPRAQAEAFLEALVRQHLAGLPAARVHIFPRPGADIVNPVPAFDPESGRWSAFIDPGMGSMFADAPGLDLAPNLERQADMLAGIGSIRPTDFSRALAQLTQAPEGAAGPGPRQDPRQFLLAVMQDEKVALRERIRAAKALLPYWK